VPSLQKRAAFEAEMQPLSGLGGLLRGFPSVGPPPLFPPAVQRWAE